MDQVDRRPARLPDEKIAALIAEDDAYPLSGPSSHCPDDVANMAREIQSSRRESRRLRRSISALRSMING